MLPADLTACTKEREREMKSSKLRLSVQFFVDRRRPNASVDYNNNYNTNTWLRKNRNNESKSCHNCLKGSVAVRLRCGGISNHEVINI